MLVETAAGPGVEKLNLILLRFAPGKLPEHKQRRASVFCSSGETLYAGF